MNMSLIRLLDAAADRAVEGLRVIEDYTRFVLNDRFLTETLKSFRHRLVELLSVIPLELRLRYRETQHDVGTSITLDSERRREDFGAILRANFSRLQEALRSLEETAKCVAPEIASGLEQLRYESYTLQKAVLKYAQKETSGPQILVSACWRRIEKEAAETLAAWLQESKNDRSGNWLLLEDLDNTSSETAGGGPALSDREKYLLGVQWKRLAEPIGWRIVLLARADLARAIGANAVLLDSESLPLFSVRDALAPGVLIGIQVSAESEVQQAILDAADFVVPTADYPSDRLEGLQIPVVRRQRDA